MDRILEDRYECLDRQQRSVMSSPACLAEGILFTDQYQLTMAQLFFHNGLHEQRVEFDYFFRNYPNYGSHQAGYCIQAGLGSLIDWMSRSRFCEPEIECLRKQTDPRSGKRIFDEDFLDWLLDKSTLEHMDLRAIPEGRVIHPNIPIVMVKGPLALAQILESSLLNHMNYQTLVATKASRIREAGLRQPLIDFGMRRGQGKGVNAGARAALIGGADFSSNVGISHDLGFPPKGTHGHSMVQIFMALGYGELAAFKAFAELYPDSCILLVDTIDTLNSGIPNAIKVFQDLKRKGHTPLGIRLDSGDEAYLSIQAARLLDAAGFKETKIVLSNNLDELVIWQILTQIRQEAPRYGIDPDHLIKRLMYGVGTRLITSSGDAALDGVYKLVAVSKEGVWIPSIKVSETPEKTVNPGEKNVWRIYDRNHKAVADVLGLESEKLEENPLIVLQHPTEMNKRRVIDQKDVSRIEVLLKNMIKDGRIADPLPTIEEMRVLRDQDLDVLHEGVKRIINPHQYHVSVTEELWNLKQDLIKASRSGKKTPNKEGV